MTQNAYSRFLVNAKLYLSYLPNPGQQAPMDFLNIFGISRQAFGKHLFLIQDPYYKDRNYHDSGDHSPPGTQCKRGTPNT